MREKIRAGVRCVLTAVLISVLAIPTPALASVRLTQSDGAILPSAAAVLADAQEGIASLLDVASPTIADRDFITRSCTIDAGGTYFLADAETLGTSAVTVTVSTDEEVIIRGLTEEAEEAGETPETVNVQFKAAQAGVNLTLRNVSLANEAGLTLIDLTGDGNQVAFEGTNHLQIISSGSDSGAAAIHVGKGCSATFGGEGTLYLYSSSGGAGIGGKTGEVNGSITFGQEGYGGHTESTLTIFAMNRAKSAAGADQSGKGAIIGVGSGTSTSDEPGAITFNSGTYYLSRCGDGSAIQGPSGGSSAQANVVMNGANVYVIQNIQSNELTKNSWFHTVGAAAEVTADNIGTLTYYAGNLLTYVTTLGGYAGRLGYDGEAYLPGITDAVINLQRKNGANASLVPCYVDTRGLDCAGSDSYKVLLDDEVVPIYDGELPTYSVQETSVYPSLNWEQSTQTTLCFYLTPVSHKLTINEEEVEVTWNSQAHAFDVALPHAVTTTYKIGYNLAGGVNAAANPTTYSSDTEGITLAEPTRTGYQFTGWTDLGGKDSTGIAAGTTGYQEFTAHWQAESRTVTYRDASGTNQTISAKYDTTVIVDGVSQTLQSDLTLPDDPAAGYAHRVYTLVSSSDTQLVFTSESVEVLTYAITYDLDGGVNDLRNLSEYTVKSPLILLYDPTREGYSFDGWTCGGQAITSLPTGSTGDREMVAHWSQNTLDVTFTDAAGAVATELVAPGRQVYVDGAPYADAAAGLTVADPAAREGWGTAGYTVTRDAYGNLLLTTTYGDPQTYSLSYDLAGGTAGEAYPDSYRADLEGLTLANPTRAQYAFAGFVDANGKMMSTVGSDGTVSTIIPAGTVGDLSLTATWTTDYKTVRYLGTDGQLRTALLPGGSTYTTAQLIALDGTSVTVDLSGYAGDTIYVAPTPTSTQLGYGMVAYTLTADNDSGTLTFAETPCLPITYHITYDLEGGSGAEENPASYTVDTPLTSLVAPVRTGYGFDGWYDAAGTLVTYVGGGATGDVALTAHWNAEHRTLTYLTPDGQEATVEVSYGSTYTIDGGDPVTVTEDARIPDPTREPDAGYLCVGYDVTVDAAGRAVFTSRSGQPALCTVTIVDPLDTTRKAADGSYYRKAAITATVDGQQIKSGTVVPNGTVVKLTVYPLDGYVFDQFTLNGTGVGAQTYQVTVTTHSTISAEVRDVRACTASIADESDGKVTYSVTKTGIVYVGGVQQWVEDKEVKDGDPLYEEDVLTLTATLAEGAEPDDPDLTYKEDDGTLGACRFRANHRDDTIAAPGKYAVTSTELAQITDGKLSIEVLCPAERQKNWLQLADTSWYDSSDPQSAYYLTTPEQLAGMVRLINDGVTQFNQTTIALARDISLANDDGTTGRRLWTSTEYDGTTQNQDKVFKGTFDGAGYTISDLDISVKDVDGRNYNALFAAAENATFKNLTIDGTVDTVTSMVAALVAYASDCTIENVTNRATVRGCNEFAGIVAELTGTGASKLTSCRNEGTVEYGYNAQNSGGTCGGVVANINELTTVTDCVNTGTISTNINDGFAGGIVGHAGGSLTKLADMTITGCRNYGTITVRTDAESPKASRIGGIIGMGSCTITRCANYGDVANVSTSGLQVVNIGGIVGTPGGKTVITYCANQGDISVQAGSVVCAGGIAGWYDGGGTIMYCANQGVVDTGSALNDKTAPADYAKASGAGGLVGMASANGTDLYYSYNAGMVIGDSAVASSLMGGAIGVSYGTYRLTGVLYLQNTAPTSCGSCMGAGKLEGADARKVTADELRGSATTLNEGTDSEAFLEDLLGANAFCPLLTWMADRTVTFLGDDGAKLHAVAVPESFTASLDDIADRYREAFGGDPAATDIPEGCTQADFSYWDNVTAGQQRDILSTAEGDVLLQAVYAYDHDTYAIVYHMEDGTAYDGANPATYQSAVGVVSFADASSAIGEFTGWCDAAGAVVTAIAAGTTGVVDLYATWNPYVESSDLDGEILYARQLASAYAISSDGSDVVYTRYWATAAAQSALLAQVAAAQEVAEYPFLTKSESDQALAALKSAEETFKAQLAKGSYRCAITGQPTSVTAASGAKVTLQVSTNDRDAVASYEWQYSTDGTNWNGAKNFVKSDGSGFATAKLVFTMGKGYGGVKWRCKVTFKDGTTEYSDVATTTLYVAPSSDSSSDTTSDTGSSSVVTTYVSAATTPVASVASSEDDAVAAFLNNLQPAQSDADDEVEDEGPLSGYANALAEVASQGFLGLSLYVWILIIVGLALILGVARSVRQSHKYDNRLKEWM